MPASSKDLTPSQAHALFNILTHDAAYREIEKFKFADTIGTSGFPFTEQEGGHSYPSSVPLLNGLFRKWVLTCPGFTNLPADFWQAKVQPLVTLLGAAELSESYDKGSMGMRKTLATAEASILESLIRGCLGGFQRQDPPPNLQASSYDQSNAQDLERAWNDCLQGIVHGSFMDDVIDFLAETENLEEHSPGVRAAVDYVIIHIATFLHHICVLTPEGQTLVKFVGNAHGLVPYTMIRQTLWMANAATMIGAMTTLLLAKFSFTGTGMNLLQRIISSVLSWDCSEFKKTEDRVGKSRDGPSKEQLAAIKNYLQKDRSEHDRVRLESMEGQTSIISAALTSIDPSLNEDMSESNHALCQEYLAAGLSIRDREEITSVFCQQNPDLFTDGVRDLVAAFEPMIRGVHEKISLSDPVTGAEKFLNDFVEMSKTAGRPGEKSAPSVEDYVRLLRRHRFVLFGFWHSVVGQCPETIAPFRIWLRDAVALFRSDSSGGPADANSETSNANLDNAAGAMTSKLNELFNGLDDSERAPVVAALDKHASYLKELDAANLQRMQRILDNLKEYESRPGLDKKQPSQSRLTPFSTPTPSATASREKLALPRSMSGPGVYLARWQALMDETLITCGTPRGPPRCGRDIRGEANVGRDASNEAAALSEQHDGDLPRPPDIGVVRRSLEKGFTDVIGNLPKLA